MLYCVFPLESSAKRNKKSRTVYGYFVLLTHCFVQARHVFSKQKPLFRVAFLLRFALVNPPGFEPGTPTFSLSVTYLCDKVVCLHICLHCKDKHKNLYSKSSPSNKYVSLAKNTIGVEVCELNIKERAIKLSPHIMNYSSALASKCA